MNRFAAMNAKRLIKGTTLGVVGFLLSPLSWWNDLFVNVPLALVFAWLIGLFYPPAFNASFVIGYWLTNVLGFVLMHKGAQSVMTDRSAPYTRKTLLRDLAVSFLYTGLILLLIKLRIVQPLPNYFSGK